MSLIIDLGLLQDGKITPGYSNLPDYLLPSQVMLQRFAANPKAALMAADKVELTASSRYSQSNQRSMSFGLLGFTAAYRSYEKLCQEGNG